jgi:S-adenosylmethionine-dependent methyltransferase
MSISPSLIEYYTHNEEESRYLRQQLEFEVTKKFFDSWIPSGQGPLSVLEVGAGSGYYTKGLLARGHEVVSVEPTPSLQASLEILKTSYPEQLSLLKGDDEALPLIHKTFHHILLMGPLYHLFEESQRLRLLKNAQDKLKPQGQIFSVFLSRLGFLSYLMKSQPELVLENPESLGVFLQKGYDPEAKPQGQFHGHFDSLQSIVELHQKAGLSITRVVGLDPLIGPYDEHFNNLTPELKPFWVEVAYHVSSWPESLGSCRTWGFVSEISSR